jgi:hypothetical protein
VVWLTVDAITMVHHDIPPIKEFVMRSIAVGLDTAAKIPVLGSESEFEAVRGLTGEPGSGLFGDMRGMIVEDQLDRRMGRIGGVEKLEEFDEFAAAVAILDQGWTLPVSRSMPASKLTVPWRLYSCSRAKVAWRPGSGGKSGAVVAIAWIPGFSS